MGKIIPLGETDNSNPDLEKFFIDCFMIIITKHGFLESSSYLMVFSSCPVLALAELSMNDISRLHKKG